MKFVRGPGSSGMTSSSPIVPYVETGFPSKCGVFYGLFAFPLRLGVG